MSIFSPSKKSPRIFANPVLDGLSRTPVWVVPLVYVPAVIYLVYRALAIEGLSVWLAAGLVAVGVVAWTLVEYWLHRTLFHWEPKTSWGPRMHFFLHGVHHEQPNDPYRLVMPLPVSAILFFGFLALWLALFGSAAWAFHAGFVAGYVFYDVTHYCIHHLKPQHRYFKQLRRHHLSHHFNSTYTDQRFGVSTWLWDTVFQTRQVRKDS